MALVFVTACAPPPLETASRPDRWVDLRTVCPDPAMLHEVGLDYRTRVREMLTRPKQYAAATCHYGGSQDHEGDSSLSAFVQFDTPDGELTPVERLDDGLSDRPAAREIEVDGVLRGYFDAVRELDSDAEREVSRGVLLLVNDAQDVFIGIQWIMGRQPPVDEAVLQRAVQELAVEFLHRVETELADHTR